MEPRSKSANASHSKQRLSEAGSLVFSRTDPCSDPNPWQLHILTEFFLVCCVRGHLPSRSWQTKEVMPWSHLQHVEQLADTLYRAVLKWSLVRGLVNTGQGAKCSFPGWYWSRGLQEAFMVPESWCEAVSHFIQDPRHCGCVATHL